MSFPTGNEMFQFPAFASYPYLFKIRYLLTISGNDLCSRSRKRPCRAAAPRGRPKVADAQSRLRCFAPVPALRQSSKGKEPKRCALRKADRPSPLMRRARAAPAFRRRAVRRVSAQQKSLPDIKGGFPHSEIYGSKPIRSSPQLIAAYHVLHRLCMPRHPPNALLTLDRSHCQCPSFVARIACPKSRRLFGHAVRPYG